MGFPIKTSDPNWLSKAVDVFNQRISISIIDDANFGINENSDSLRMFKRHTLSLRQVILLLTFYLIALTCMVLLYLSFSLHYAKYLGIGLSVLFLIVCITIPTYFFVKNKAPLIFKSNLGVEIKFHNPASLEQTVEDN